VCGWALCSVVEHQLAEAPVLTWDPAGEAHRDEPISQPGVVKVIVAADFLYHLFLIKR